MPEEEEGPSLEIHPAPAAGVDRERPVELHLGPDFIRAEPGSPYLRIEKGAHLTLAPGEFLVARSFETIILRRGEASILGRSSWGRLGLTIATAIRLAEGFHGTAAIELANVGSTPVILSPGMPIAQLVWHAGIAHDPPRPGRYSALLRPEFSELHERVNRSPPTTGALTDVIDVFICHASEDKETVARPLAQALLDLGFTVWFDEFSLRPGDSLRKKIDDGLARARRGVVICSSAFFAKRWPQEELGGLYAKEIHTGQSIIIPVWHELSHSDVVGFSPLLADRVALSTAGGIDRLIRDVAAELSAD